MIDAREPRRFRVRAMAAVFASALLSFRGVSADRAPQRSVETPALRLVLDGDGRRATGLANRRTNTAWLRAPSPLFRVFPPGGTAAKLRAEPLANGQVRLRLTVTNTSDAPRKVGATFPLLEGIGTGKDANDLAYCFPKSGAAVSSQPIDIRRRYSGLFPLQFMDVWHRRDGGVYLMTQDLEAHPKTFWLRKAQRPAVDFGVDHAPRMLTPGEAWALPPAVLGAHEGDWHAALAAYRRWVATWYEPAAPRKRWFGEVFNFRQEFLHPNLGLPHGAFDPKAKALRLAEMVRDDAAAFGGVDFVHVFDWSHTPAHGRVGQYDPWAYLGGVRPFRREVAKLRAAGTPVGAYLEGYLISREADVAKRHGEEWQMLTAEGKPYARFGPGYVYPCPHVPEWREYLAAACERVCRQADVDGVYVDELGFGYQYACHNTAHGHEVPSVQVREEMGLLRAVRRSLPAGTVLYTEETPVDVATQLLDGSFTYAIAGADRRNNPARVNLTRFALPSLKTFEIIRCDRPLGNDLDAVRSIFFNGEGIWLEGPLSIEKWFPPEVRRLIARTHRILREHRDAFRSNDVVPLVPTLYPGLYANRFVARDKVVWTLYNASREAVCGEALDVRHVAGAAYFDAWNGRAVTARIRNDRAAVALTVPPGDVSCLVQLLTPSRQGEPR